MYAVNIEMLLEKKFMKKTQFLSPWEDVKLGCNEKKIVTLWYPIAWRLFFVDASYNGKHS